jgi:hypothetical protein
MPFKKPIPPVFEDMALKILLGFAPLPRSEPWQEAQLACHSDFPTNAAACRGSVDGFEATGAGAGLAAGVVVVVAAAVVSVGVALLVPPPQAVSNTAAVVEAIKILRLNANWVEILIVQIPRDNVPMQNCLNALVHCRYRCVKL